MTEIRHIGDDPPMPLPVEERRASVRLFGEPAVRLADGRIVALERRAAALLALAALEPGISRLRAAMLLWPDSADPRRNLRQQLLRFRQQFGHPLIEGDGALTLVAELAAPGEDGASLSLLAGLDYDDCEDFSAWLQVQRGAGQQRRAAALHEAMQRAESEHRLDDAIDCARQLLAEDPAAETHHRDLIRLHYLNQDVARARAAFDTLQRMLDAEFGVAPSVETRSLMRLVEQDARAAPAPVRVSVTALTRPPRMVGRGRELAALHQALTARRALLLLGEAGMGKSRLLAEGLEATAGHALVKAQAGDAGVPYATLARLLRRLLEQRRMGAPAGALTRLLPEIGPLTAPAGLPLPADGERLLLQTAVEQVLAQPGVDAVAVDDLHFADDASLEMLTALVASEALARLAWIFTQRPGEGSPASRVLRDRLEEAQRLDTVDVAPLDAGQMTELLRSLQLPGLDAEAVAPRLLRHTGGNPLFALETLKQMLLPGASPGTLPQPVSVGALIDRRLKQLSAGAIGLARVAAIAGPDFSPALAEAVLGRRAIDLADAWAELESAQVLRERAFAHDLVLDAALRSVPGPIAQHLHAAVAQHLEAHQGMPARIAGHWLAAGDDARALPGLVQAAEQARHGLRLREAAGFLERAAGIAAAMPGAGGPSAFELWLQVHQALECVDGDAPARRALDQALLHARNDRDRFDVLTARVSSQVMQYDLAAAIADGREALRLALAAQDAAMMARVLTPLATSLSIAGHNDEAAMLLDAHWATVEQQASLQPSDHCEHGVVLDNLGRPAAARAAFGRAIAMTIERGLHSEQLMARKNLAVSFIDTGELDAAMAELEAAERVRLAHDGLQGANHLGWNLQGMALRDLGRYGEALDRFELSVAACTEQMPARLALDRLHRAWLWGWTGQWARALQDIGPDEAFDLLPGWALARALQLRARLALWRGMPTGDALARARAAHPTVALRPLHDSIVIDVERAAGRDSPASAKVALRRLDGLRQKAQTDGYYGVRWAAEWASAELALAAGRQPQARAHLQACLQRPADQQPQDCALGTWWHGLWRVAQRLEEHDAAEAARAEGVAWIHRTLQGRLPAVFHDSFRSAVAAHRELLAG